MESLRFSLRSGSPAEVKQRQAQAAAYVEAVFDSGRENRPLALTREQTVALAGRLYRSWAGDLENSTHPLH